MKVRSHMNHYQEIDLQQQQQDLLAKSAAITEAFDEPLTKEAVLAIATPFIKK